MDENVYVASYVVVSNLGSERERESREMKYREHARERRRTRRISGPSVASLLKKHSDALFSAGDSPSRVLVVVRLV